MNTTQIEYLMELCRTLNYSRAAENLEISQPTLSKAMKHLESELHFSLFEKDGRGIRMTKETEQFLPYATQAIALLKEGVQEAQNQKQTIHIGCVTSVQIDYLPQFIHEYTTIHRNARFHIMSGISDELIDALRAHKIDGAICTAPSSNDIESFPLITQDLMLCVPSSHRLAKEKSVSLSAFQNEKLVAHRTTSIMHKLVKSLYDHHNIQPDIIAEAEEDNSIISLIRTGIGVGIVSKSKNLITDGVVLIPIEQDIIHRNVSFCYRKNDDRNKAFIRFMQSHRI